MLKQFKIIFTLLFATFLFSCSEDNPSEQNKFEKDLIGTWVYKYTNLRGRPDSVIFVFGANGSGYGPYLYPSYSFKYKCQSHDGKNNVSWIYDYDGDQVICEDVIIIENTLRLNYSGYGASRNSIFIRQ